MSVCVCMCVCVSERERECVCVCLCDDGADSTADCGGMTDLRSKLKSQIKELEMRRPQLAIERQQQQATVNQV